MRVALWLVTCTWKPKVLDTDQKSIVCFISKDLLNEEAAFELNKFLEIESKLNTDELIYKTGNKKRINI